MNTSLNMLQVAVRIFPEGSVVRHKLIYVNIPKVMQLPVQASTLDIQNCCFWYLPTATKLPMRIRLKLFWYFKVLGKSHIIKDW